MGVDSQPFRSSIREPLQIMCRVVSAGACNPGAAADRGRMVLGRDRRRTCKDKYWMSNACERRCQVSGRCGGTAERYRPLPLGPSSSRRLTTISLAIRVRAAAALVRHRCRSLGGCVYARRRSAYLPGAYVYSLVKAQQSLARLLAAFVNKSKGKTTIYNWFAEFKRDRVNPSDGFRGGRPSTAVNNKNIDAVRRVIKTDRHVTYHEIRTSVGISMSQKQSFLYKHLDMKKLC
ncbi:hypothetical protein EVAR_95048_1 [Eumeta japonica]|uniref:Mos1 transposase HTH domain-containing protein n=1 Tax=Eumeta variegata TaxID=151549 RepID=A0A4C1W502_EUMVA|nr:hypothetical protein EVAR_95048_1 [Eumeta japonica]